jgi:heptosyltransferase-2
VEITKSISKYKLLSKIVISFLKSFFFLIRSINKFFVRNKGNVVVVSLHRLGDAVFTIPAVREIQKFYRRKIIILCYPDAVPIYKLGLSDSYFCEVSHENFYFGDRIAGFKARKILRSTKPEIIFDFTGVMTSATLIFSSRAKKIIGMNREQFKSIYDVYIPIRSNPHLMDRYIDIAATVIPGINREQIKRFPVSMKRVGKILVHPFGGWKSKEWNLNKFIELAIRLNKEYNVCLIAPEKSVPRDVATLITKEKISTAQTRSIRELIEQVEQCSVFIGNDSGPLYIASLLGKPTFTIYGPTNSDFSHPIGEHHQYISQKVKCSPSKNQQYCFTTGGQVGCPAFQCMNLLKFEEVFPNVLQFVQKYCNPRAKLKPLKS